MFALSKKMFLACMLILVVLTTGAWQGDRVVLAKSLNADAPETPLYPGLTWGSPVVSAQDIRINLNGDSISLSGERYEARERFTAGLPLPQDVLNYYSNEALAKSGWASHDTFEAPGGVHYVFYHEYGAYLSVEFIPCAGDASAICVAVWKSGQTDPVSAPANVSEPENITAAAGSFGKKTPANGSVNQNPASVVLSWEAYSPAPDKYSYCVNVGSACDATDPDWTSAYSTSVTLTNLAYDKTYYWQVKAITCVTCVPKTVVYADNGVAWTFKTKLAAQVAIIGNAGVGGAVLNYTDGTPKTVSADGNGNYSITLPLNWSGTVTPSKSGYLFSPKNASFTNLTAPQTIQNFNAIPTYVISGKAGLPGVTLSYIDADGAPQTVISNSNGRYSITAPSGWSGTVTPSKTGFTFLPASRNYTNVTANKTAQNYTALVSISGNAGAAGATLSYTDGVLKMVTANGSGDYSFSVPVGWTGPVTPSLTGFTFAPVSRSYNNLQSNQTSQNYAAIDAPVVLSSARLNASPTSAPSVGFTVTFSESVNGVDAGDFSLTTGLAGTGITNVSGSGAVYTVTVNTGTGSGTLRLDVVDDDSIQDGSNNPLGGAGAGNGNFTGGQVYEVNQMTVLSLNTRDGWILESTETSSVGGYLNKNAAALKLGDDAANRQYRSILSFDASALPDNAVITSVTLKFKGAGVSGTNPFNTHGNLLADVRVGAFSANAALELTDFSAKGVAGVYKSNVLIYANAPVDNWYSQTFNPADFIYVNLAGITQFRLRFGKGDNDDFGADFLKIVSGNAAAENRPQLIIQYQVP